MSVFSPRIIVSKIRNFFRKRTIPFWMVKVRHLFYRAMGNTPVLIYTMGKVGSSTVYHTLQFYKISPLIYHCHYLSMPNISWMSQKYKEKIIKTRKRLTILKLFRGDFDHLTASIILSSLYQKKEKKRLRLITLVRDPVDTFLSHIFQNPHSHRPELIGKDGFLDKKKIEKYINDYFVNFDSNRDFISTWIDQELGNFTGIDLYKYPFAPSEGYNIIRKGSLEIAIIALENMEDSLPKVINRLSSFNQAIYLKDKNVRDLTKEGIQYKSIKQNIVIPREGLEKVYSTKYAKHFFSEKFREERINRWSKPRNIQK